MIVIRYIIKVSEQKPIDSNAKPKNQHQHLLAQAEYISSESFRFNTVSTAQYPTPAHSAYFLLHRELWWRTLFIYRKVCALCPSLNKTFSRSFMPCVDQSFRSPRLSNTRRPSAFHKYGYIYIYICLSVCRVFHDLWLYYAYSST